MTSGSPAASDVAPEFFGGAAPLPWLLRRANQRYRAAIRERLAECGFNGLPQPGYWALMILGRGGTDASQLIREMGVSKQAVSKLVDALATMGFVDRMPNRADRRRSELRLSAKGRRAADVIGEAVRTTEEAFVNELGAKQFTDLVQMLAQVTRQAD
jgi:DNA-binding MarR family transcriptional regulator